MKNLKTIMDDFISRRLDAESIYSESATVISVDLALATAEVSIMTTGNVIQKVRLSSYRSAAFGVLLVPLVGSVVTISFLSNNEAFISKTSELEGLNIIFDNDGSMIEITTDTIIFNGGTLDGLVTVNELTTKLNDLVNTVNAFMSEYGAHVHATAAVGPVSIPTPPKTTPDAAAFNKDDYENDLILQ